MWTNCHRVENCSSSRYSFLNDERDGACGLTAIELKIVLHQGIVS